MKLKLLKPVRLSLSTALNANQQGEVTVASSGTHIGSVDALFAEETAIRLISKIDTLTWEVAPQDELKQVKVEPKKSVEEYALQGRSIKSRKELEALTKDGVSGKLNIESDDGVAVVEIEDTKYPIWVYGASNIETGVTHEVKLYMRDDATKSIYLTISNDEEVANEANIYELGKAAGMSAELVGSLIAIMESYKLPAAMMMDVAKQWKAYPTWLEPFIPNHDKVCFVETNRELYSSIALIVDGGCNLRFAGIQSTGKTTLAEQVAIILQRPFLTVSGSEESTQEDLIGDFTLKSKVVEPKGLEQSILDIKKQAQENGVELENRDILTLAIEQSKPAMMQSVEFQKWFLVIAMEYGCILYLDEIDQIRKNVLIKMHSALDYRRSLDVRGINRTIKGDPNFTVMAAMNGTEDMLESTESRFVTLELSPPADIAPILLKQCPSVTTKELSKISSLYKLMLNGYKQGEIIGAFISIRSFINAINHRKYFTLKESVSKNLRCVSYNDKVSIAKVESYIDQCF